MKQISAVTLPSLLWIVWQQRKTWIIKPLLLCRSWRTYSNLPQSMSWLSVQRMWPCFISMWVLDTGWVLKGTFNSATPVGCFHEFTSFCHCIHSLQGLHRLLAEEEISCVSISFKHVLNRIQIKNTVCLLDRRLNKWYTGSVPSQNHLQWGCRHPKPQLPEFRLSNRGKQDWLHFILNIYSVLNCSGVIA